MTTHLISANSGADSAGAYDNQIDIDNPTLNKGTLTTLTLNLAASYRGLFGFDIPSGLAGASVSGSTFSVYNRFGDAATLTLYKLRRVPGETTSTWNTYDGTNNWTTAGALSTTTDYDSAALATRTSGVTGYEDMTGSGLDTAIQAAIGGTLWMVLDASAFCSVNTKEASDTLRPKLSVVYTAAVPSGLGASTTRFTTSRHHFGTRR